jgi:uncharacterized protein (DUF1330 family)
VNDPKLYREYQAAAAPTIQASGGEVVAFDVAAETIEGTPPGPQTVIVKFESTEAAKAWYQSPGHEGHGNDRNDPPRIVTIVPMSPVPACPLCPCFRACAVEPITSTTPAATGPIDRPTTGTPIQAAWQHWRLAWHARVRLVKVLRCLLGALDKDKRPAVLRSSTRSGVGGESKRGHPAMAAVGRINRPRRDL